MSLLDRASLIAELLASDEPRAELAAAEPPGALPRALEIRRRVARWKDQLGLERPRVPADDDPPDPRHFVWWLLSMAGETYARALEPAPPIDPALIDRFEGLSRSRPRELEEHAQLHVDPASTLRRALAVRERLRAQPGAVLAVGDDDAVTLALGLLGVPALHAVDIDERLLEYLERAGAEIGVEIRVGCVDVFEDEAPRPWRGAFSCVITDPIRSYEPCLAFLRYAAACLAPQPAGLFWADHPDWNLDHARVLAALAGLGLRVEQALPLLHAYPLTSTWFSDLPAKADAVGVDRGWLARLAAAALGWSHLYVLAPAPAFSAGR